MFSLLLRKIYWRFFCRRFSVEFFLDRFQSLFSLLPRKIYWRFFSADVLVLNFSWIDFSFCFSFYCGNFTGFLLMQRLTAKEIVCSGNFTAQVFSDFTAENQDKSVL